MWIALFAGTLVALGGALNVAHAQATGPRPPDSVYVTSHAIAMAAAADPLSLEDAIRQALLNNPDVLASKQQIEPLRSRTALSRLLPPPVLEAQVWQWPVNTVDPRRTDSYMFMASQDLPGKGKRAATEAVGQSEIIVAERRADAREREITRIVGSAYWDLLIARRAIEIHVASVDLLHQLTDMAEIKYAAGRGSQQDVLKATVETTRLHDDLITLEQDAEQARLRLNAVMGRSLDMPVGPLSGLDEMTLAVTIAQLQGRAFDEQPELRLARAEIDRARAEQDEARSTSSPDWSIGGGYMLRPRQTDAWLARVSVTWPGAPWARRAIDIRTATAAASVKTAESAATVLETRTRLAASDAYTRAKAAEQRAALVRTTLLPQSRQVLESSRTAFESDRGDFVTVIENERAVLEAELTYQRALASWRLAVTDLEFALGAALPSVMLRSIPTAEVR